VNPGTVETLVAITAELPPPFALLEDGRGVETCALAWGGTDRLRVEWSEAAVGSLDRFACGPGYVGCTAYDLGLPPKAVRRAPPLAQPLVDLFRPAHRIILRPGRAPEVSDDEARERWEAAAGERRTRRRAEASTVGAQPGVPPGTTERKAAAERRAPARSFSQPAFEAAVRQALEYIRAGDIYQINLSVAQRVLLDEPPLAVYRRLRAINPSPWMAYADFGDWQLLCGSPELLVEVKGGRARAKPIAGTRKKTGDPVTDAAMRRELRSDAKERAEHVMLVDLARNDLGRIAEYGTVEVAELGTVEEYSHVMHLVSDVRARPAAGVGPDDVFRALFPGGTVTGTPKVRAMEIIAELEPVARGMYTGAFGWTGVDAAQWNILIRSAVVRGGEAVVQAGAGIVADSDPTREWKESLRKAEALRLAFGLGHV
jgi:anthranilate/para-aminobenzoate synthase component I